MYKMELQLYGSRQLIEWQRGGGHQLTDLYVIEEYPGFCMLWLTPSAGGLFLRVVSGWETPEQSNSYIYYIIVCHRFCELGFYNVLNRAIGGL